MRDLHADATAGLLTVTVDGGNNNALDLNPSLTGDGVFTVTYDGDSTNSAASMGTQLGTGTSNFDLTQGGGASAFQFSIGAESANTFVIVRVLGVGGTSTTLPISVPITTNGASATLVIPFSSLTGTANLTEIGAIQFEISQDSGGDTQIDDFQLVGPTVFSADMANLTPMSIGNLVFLDRDNDSVFAGTDTGIGGVDLQLFNDVNIIGHYEPGIDTVVTVGTSTTTTSTATNTLGQYRFTGLLPGSYIVLIPASEFGPGQLLANHSSSPNVAPVDTNDADRGAPSGSGTLNGVFASVVLASAAEPTNDGDSDPNTNLANDFGFTSRILQLSITDSPDPVTIGQTLTYTVTATNTGPSNATNTRIIDTLPVGLAIVSASYSVNGGAAQNAIFSQGVVSTDLFTLSANQATVMTIVAVVGANFVSGAVNSGTVTSDEVSPVNASTSTSLTSNVDLGIVATIGNGLITVGVGGELSYRLTLTNLSDSTTVTGIEINNDLPTGFTPITLPTGVTLGLMPNDLVWSIPVLPPMGSSTIEFPVAVSSTAPLGTATNTASIDIRDSLASTIRTRPITRRVSASPWSLDMICCFRRPTI